VSDLLIDFRIKTPLRDDDASPPVPLPDDMDIYAEVYGMQAKLNLTFAHLVGGMEKYGIRGVLQTEFEDGAGCRALNERTAELLARRPDLFYGGIATVDPRESTALAELEYAHDVLGLRGLIFQPAFVRMKPSEPAFTPLYAYCAERDVPVTIHTGVNFTQRAPFDYGRPLWIDHVACDFPELTLVANHGGFPWVMESIACAWRHTNVYLEFGAIAPKYLAHPDSGYAPLPHWMRTQIRDKVLLGTDWPMLDHERLVRELPLLELGDVAEQAYVAGNALRIIDRVWPDHQVTTNSPSTED
jgi:predicted TIM-barrel fold metal-dependent hydrolase